MKAILLIISVLLSFPVSAQPFTGCAAGNEKVRAQNENLEKEILRLLNQEREKRGLHKLVWDKKLTSSARYHAADMATDNYFEHASYDRKRGSLVRVCGTFDRIEAFDKTSAVAHAENISAGRTSAQAIFDGWMKSDGHRLNMLSTAYRRIGIGYFRKKGSDWGSYCVQCLGN